MNDTRVGIIGSGLGGLATACVLAARGYKVEVFEKNPWLGGKAAQLNERGFRFDMGPTILIQPSVLRRVFTEAKRNLDDYIPMMRLSPQWRCFFEDGRQLDLLDDSSAMASQLEAIWPGMGAGYLDFLRQSEQLHSMSDRFFFWRSVGSMRDTMDVRGAFDLAVLRDVMRMRLGKTVSGVIRENIPDPNTAQMLDHFVQYVGSSPDASPAILCSIGHMQMEEGIWYPMGGTRAIPEGLVKLATELGVIFHPSTDVASINSDSPRHTPGAGRVTGLTTTDGAASPLRRHRLQLRRRPHPSRTHRRSGRPHTSTTSATTSPPAPASSSTSASTSATTTSPTTTSSSPATPTRSSTPSTTKASPHPTPPATWPPPQPPTPPPRPPAAKLSTSSSTRPTCAPTTTGPKCSPPTARSSSTSSSAPPASPTSKTASSSSSALTPQDIHDRYRVLNGAIYGISSHGVFNGAFKPANRSRELEGLYLAGGAAHPGPGMPMVLMSGWIAADSLDQDFHQAGAKVPA